MSASKTSGHNLVEYTVSQISQSVRRTIEEQYGYVKIRGEISGLSRPGSGHIYLSLKDEGAVLSAVCWRGVAAKFPFKPEDGLEVVCTGKMTAYAGQSRYQLVIDYMEPAGIGSLMAMLEKRKLAFQKEGLFDTSRKKPIPFLARKIGIITSPTGAVIQDMLHRIEGRFPVEIQLWPVKVQGEGAAEEIAAAIAGFNAMEDAPELLIVARGGGSIEDLWAFNEEIVVRSVSGSHIPIISAVGHETDTTLIDYVADLRAPTPTAAAEFAVPVKRDLQLGVRELQERLTAAFMRMLSDRSVRVTHLFEKIPTPEYWLMERRQRIDQLELRLHPIMDRYLLQAEKRLNYCALRLPHPKHVISLNEERLSRLSQQLQASIERLMQQRQQRLKLSEGLLKSYSYDQTLQRGFALVRDGEGHVVTSRQNLVANDVATIEFHDGVVSTVIKGENK